jgi:IS5 family transposase
MEKQVSFGDIDFQNKKKKTKKEIFLEKMSKCVPLKMFCDLIRPFYYVNGNGRQPISLEIMMKMYLVSNWYNLSDEATEDLLYDSLTVKSYIGVTNNVPDATTLGKFRVEIIEKNNLNKKIFDELNKRLVADGVMFREGTIVDATIIDAPDSFKNKSKKPNPEMSSARKGNSCYFGFKAHIGADEDSGLVHSVTVTTASESDVAIGHTVLHGEEVRVRGDAGYIGLQNRLEVCEKFQDGTGEVVKVKLKKNRKHKIHYAMKKRESVEFIINKKPSGIKEDELVSEEQKSRIRAKVEHAFGLLKHIFGFRKTRLRTLSKNHNKLYMLFTLANIYRCSQRNISTN